MIDFRVCPALTVQFGFTCLVWGANSALGKFSGAAEYQCGAAMALYYCPLITAIVSIQDLPPITEIVFSMSKWMKSLLKYAW